MIGYAVHLVHTFFELLQYFPLLICERVVQFLTAPDSQLQQFIEPLVTTSALFEMGKVAAP